MSRSIALWRVLLASLVILGTSGSSLGSVLCSLGLCDEACVSKMQSERGSCCPGEQEQPKDCHCQLADAPDATAMQPAVLSLEIPHLDFDLAPLPVSVTHVVDAETEKILAFGDSSPPLLARMPDLGRAPPVA